MSRHCRHCAGRPGLCACTDCPRPAAARCERPDPQELLDLVHQMVVAEAADSSDPSDHLPMMCKACGYQCANRAESWEHTLASGHTSFSGMPGGLADLAMDLGMNLGAMLAAAEAASSGDPQDHLPVTCTTCGCRCADRAESWQHTAETGHTHFARQAPGQRQLGHCSHCKGLDGVCACKAGCARPRHARCRVQHCQHCKGLDGPCACRAGCPKPANVQCWVPLHCQHCAGREGVCACPAGCSRPDGARCRAVGHCQHCRGFDGVCTCQAGCSRPGHAKCWAAALDMTMYHGTSWANAQRIQRDGFKPSADGCLGPGVYFANQDKAIRFAKDTSRHGGEPALVEVRVCTRTMKKVVGDDSSWQRQGYDACYPSHTSKSRNPEWCLKSCEHIVVKGIRKV
uniref:PARP catalytic domain-containing protein n=1 Tax=Pyrodinium bahamense TaxID=73915 RepID=A0A7S0A4G8_9DINO